VTQLLRFVSLLPSTIPPRPSGIDVIPAGLDPRISLPRGIEARPGSVVRVPLLWEQTDRVPVHFESFEVLVDLDPKVFKVLGVEAGDAARGFSVHSARDGSGVLVIGGFSMTGRMAQPGEPGVLAWLELEIAADATSGS
jgi:hypothetical protein